MGNKIKTILGLIILFIGVILMFYPLYYWILNDGLTQMQVAKETWYYSIGGMGIVVVGMRLTEIFK